MVLCLFGSLLDHLQPRKTEHEVHVKVPLQDYFHFTENINHSYVFLLF